MSWLDKLEQKIGHLALHGLIRYVAALMIVVYFLNANQMLSYAMLDLNPGMILKGQLWRLFTFPLVPISTNFLFLFFELSILVMCADGLEANWGTFKLSVYYVSGMLFIAIAAFILFFTVPIIIPIAIFKGSYFIYLSLFLGFATLYPDYQILLFLIVPIKIKYIAIFSVIMVLMMLFNNAWLAVPLLLSLGNYLLFFGPVVVKNYLTSQRRQKDRKAYEAKLAPARDYRHKCAKCDKTDVDSPELQFRYCTCEDCGPEGVAFCLQHLEEHKNKGKK
jgi:hypothetical protein